MAFLISNTGSVHILTYSHPQQYQHTFVCPTFPFCYQDLQTGDWKTLEGFNTLESSKESSVTRDNDSSDCWSAGFYCQSVVSNLIKRIQLDTPEECQEKCMAENQCLFFSFHDTRGQVYCSLLKECSGKTKCTSEENCATGRKTCNCATLDYLPGSKDSTSYARWKCGDVDPYSVTIPVGITCSATCTSWIDSSLQSTCLKNGRWSSSALTSSTLRVHGYSSSYPKV